MTETVPPVRLFVAIHPPPAALTDLATVVDALRVSLAHAPGHSTRLTRREGWHVTVAFLGEVAAAKVDRATRALQAVAERTEPMRLRLAGGGTFGGRRNPILWVGLTGDVAALKLLGTAMRQALRRARLPVDDRPLRPHLTLARPGSRVPPEAIAGDVTTLAGYQGPQWSVTELSLMLSEIHQTPAGPVPRYTALASAPLGT